MANRRPLAAWMLAVAVLPAVAAGGTPPPATALELFRDLPRDPLLALGIWLEDPVGELGVLAGLLDRFADDDAPAGTLGALVGADSGLIGIIQQELLPLLGPELALAVDLPPIDATVAALQFSGEEATSGLLRDVGVLARVRETDEVDRALRRLIVGAGGRIVSSDGPVTAELPLGAARQPDPLRLTLVYALRGDRLAAGFSSEWVAGALAPRSRGERLIDGQDFKRVFALLDQRPTDLAYVNLPRIRAALVESQIVKLVLENSPEMRHYFNHVLTADAMAVGLGSTSVAGSGGVRTTHFGPRWMSGTAVSSGFLAALALPNLYGAAARGKARRTTSDIRAIAVACEGFSADSRSYPGPTEGWVPVESIAGFLEPVYIGRLPRTDGWENPILYWSDGGSYRILSTGGDGEIDRDWTQDVPPQAAGDDGDIVFGDGKPLSWPSGVD